MDREGVTGAALAVISELNWIFREQSVEDYGIDAHIEVVAHDESVTGRMIGAQVKSGMSWFSKRVNEGWVFREKDRRHLNYWLENSLPVLVILYHPKRKCSYWQHVDETTVRLTPKGFKIIVPEANTLDASARSALEDIARRRGQQALVAYDRSLALLPGDTRTSLSRAAERDRTGAARLAQMLADGRAQPGMTAAQVLAAEPTWLVGSAVQEDLWSAVAAYANAHEKFEVSAKAFLRAASFGGPQAGRRRAFAGLALFRAGERDLARAELVAARNAGAVLLADVGLAYIDVPPDDARLEPVPPSMQSATESELEAETTVLNFLAELRLRDSDIDGAVKLIERAVAVSGEGSATLRLRLAELLSRRIQTKGGAGGPDSKAARAHARAALAELRRWSGPSESALAVLLDLEMLDGELDQIVGQALPVAVGGSALDREAAEPRIAGLGASAALLIHDAKALAYFRQFLPKAWMLEIAAQELDMHTQDPEERRRAWLQALKGADNDRLRAICVMRLSDLGAWPLPEAEDLLSRAIMPKWTYRIAVARAEAANGDVVGAVAELRRLANDHVLAAVDLIRILDRHGDSDQARREWDRQYRRWQDVQLVEVLPDPTSIGQPDPLMLEILSDPRLSVDARVRLRGSLIRDFARRRDWDRVVRLCRAGLAERSSEDVIWNLVTALYNLHNTHEARKVLDQYRPDPATEQEARLWAQLHVGADFTRSDAEMAAELAERYMDAPALIGGLASLLVRELGRHGSESLPTWPDSLVARVRELVLTLQASGYGPDAATEEEMLRRLRGKNYGELEAVRLEVQAGRTALSTFASQSGHPYGQALLQRFAGLTVASDREPGLITAGRQAAAKALDSGAVIADISALYLLLLLPENGRDLLARLPDLCINAGAAADAARTRDAVWTVASASFSVGLVDGKLRRQELPIEERALLRKRAADLEELTASLMHRTAGLGKNSGQDAIALAAQEGIALWADDVALRQAARHRGLATFGTTDLLATINQGDLEETTMLLAANYVVDLALDGGQVSRLESDARWHGAGGMVAISRRQWWQPRDQLTDSWQTVAAEAAKISPQTFVRMTQAALTGALGASASGFHTQVYQQVVVMALDAAHRAKATAPPDFLQQLASLAAKGIPPKPKYVYHALMSALEKRGVLDPEAEANALLPGLRFAPDTWV